MARVSSERIPTDLSRFLHEERERLDVTLDAIARDLTVLLQCVPAVTKGTVSTWETGKRLISPPMLDALGRVYGWDDDTRQRVAMLYQAASVERSKRAA